MSHFISVNTRKHKRESHIHLHYLSVYLSFLSILSWVIKHLVRLKQESYNKGLKTLWDMMGENSKIITNTQDRLPNSCPYLQECTGPTQTWSPCNISFCKTSNGHTYKKTNPKNNHIESLIIDQILNFTLHLFCFFTAHLYFFSFQFSPEFGKAIFM